MSNSEPDPRFSKSKIKDLTLYLSGIGIKAGDISKLFEPFQQLESAYSKKYQGTGLGLALSKKIVELHRGRIWMESEWEKGSRFIFTLPGNMEDRF